MKREDGDLTGQFWPLIDCLSLFGAETVLGPTQEEKAWRKLLGVTSDIRQNYPLAEALTGGNGFLPCLSLRDAAPSGSDLARFEDLALVFGLTFMSKKKAICIGHPPLRGDGIILINNKLANLTNSPVGEFKFAFIKAPPNGKVARRSDSHQASTLPNEGEKVEADTRMTVKNAEMTLTVLKSYDSTSALFLCGSGGMFAALQIFANERILKELMQYSAKTHCFSAVICMTMPDDTDPFTLIPKENMVVDKFKEVKADNQLLSHFLGGHPSGARKMSSETMRNRIRRARRWSPEKT